MMKSNYKEYIEQCIESNDLRIRNLNENIIRDLKRIANDIAREADVQKGGKDLYSINTLVSNAQSRLLDVLTTANRVQILQTQTEAFRIAFKAADELKGADA